MGNSHKFQSYFSGTFCELLEEKRDSGSVYLEKVSRYYLEIVGGRTWQNIASLLLAGSISRIE